MEKENAFGEKYLEMEDLRIEIDESGVGVCGFGATEENRVYTLESKIDKFIKCSNSKCYKGGISMRGILQKLDDIVSKKQTSCEFDMVCQGDEGSLKGKKLYQHCNNHYKIKIEIKYKKL